LAQRREVQQARRLWAMVEDMRRGQHDFASGARFSGRIGMSAYFSRPLLRHVERYSALIALCNDSRNFFIELS
jgi:hypothetical protein